MNRKRHDLKQRKTTSIETRHRDQKYEMRSEP